MVNLFLASVYDSFMLHTSIKDKSKQIQKETVEIKKEEESNFFLNLGNISKNKKINTAESQNEKKPKDMRMSVIPLKPKFTEYPGKSLFLASGKEFILNLFEKSWFRNLITLMIIGDIIVLSLDGYSISKANMILLHQFDFFFFCFFFLEISAKFISTGLDGLRKSFLFSIDFLVIYLNFAIYIYEILVGFNIFEEGSLAGAGIKTMKMIRIFKVLYYTEMFSSLSLLIRALIKTLNKMKQFFFIMLVMVVVFALIGIRLFSDRARFIDTSNGGLVYSM